MRFKNGKENIKKKEKKKLKNKIIFYEKSEKGIKKKSCTDACGQQQIKRNFAVKPEQINRRKIFFKRERETKIEQEKN